MSAMSDLDVQRQEKEALSLVKSGDRIVGSVWKANAISHEARVEAAKQGNFETPKLWFAESPDRREFRGFKTEAEAVKWLVER